MNIDFGTIIRAFALLVEAVFVAAVVPWIKSRLDAQKYEKVKAWVNAAVAAAEKIYWTDGSGVDKKAWVLDFLASKGIQIDAESLDVLIEAAVYNLPQYLDAVSAEAVTEDMSEDVGAETESEL